MVRDMYFAEDIQRGIVAVSVAMLSAAIAHGGGNVEYCRGVLDTSRAQALNYGLSWPDLADEIRHALAAAGYAELPTLEDFLPVERE